MHALFLFALLIFMPQPAEAHCKIPCGIYDDHARIHAMKEDVATISKAVTQLTELAQKTDAQSVNQQIRWTIAKEDHADQIIQTVSEYFLTQKIKPAEESDVDAHKAYLGKLKAAHAVLRAAMGAKQTVDPAKVEALGTALDALGALFPAKD